MEITEIDKKLMKVSMESFHKGYCLKLQEQINEEFEFLNNLKSLYTRKNKVPDVITNEICERLEKLKVSVSQSTKQEKKK